MLFRLLRPHARTCVGWRWAEAGGKYANLVQQQLAVDDDSAKAETATDPKAGYCL